MAPASLEEVERAVYKTYHRVEELEKEVGTIRGMMDSQRQVEEQTKDTDKQLAEALSKLADAMDDMAVKQGEIQEDIKALDEKTGTVMADVRDLISEQEEMKEEDTRREERREGMENTINLVGTVVGTIRTMTENRDRERVAEQKARSEAMARQLREFFESQAQTNKMVCIGTRHSTQCLRMLRNMTQGEQDDSDDHSSTTSDKKRRREAEHRRDTKQKVENWDTTTQKPAQQIDQPNKPHKCSHCGSSFTQRSSLLRHLKLHCPPDTRYQMLRQGKNVIHTPNVRAEKPGEESGANLQEIPIHEQLEEAITKSQTLQEAHKKRNEAPDSTRPSPEATKEMPGAEGTTPDALAEAVAETKPFTDTRGKLRSARTWKCTFCTYTSARHWNVQQHVIRMHTEDCENAKKTQGSSATDTPTTTAGLVVADTETDGRRSEEDQETADPTQREELIEIDREAGGPGDGGEEDDDEDLISDEEREGL